MRIVELMSRDGETWFVFADYLVPDCSRIVFDEEYHIRRLKLVAKGWIYWRTEVKKEGG